MTAVFSPTTNQSSPWGQNYGVWQSLSSHLPFCHFAVQEEKGEFQESQRRAMIGPAWVMCQHPVPNSMTKGNENSDWQPHWNHLQRGGRRMDFCAGTICDVCCKELIENIRQVKIFLGFSTWFASPTLSSQSPNVSLAAHPYPKARNTPFHPGSTFFLPSLNPPSKDAPSLRNFPHGIFMLWNDRSYSEKVRLQLFISDLLNTVPQGDILMGNIDRACIIPYATSLSWLHIYHRLWCLLQG